MRLDATTLCGIALAGLAFATSGASAQDAGDVLAAVEERFVSVIEQVEPSVVSVVTGDAAAGRMAPDPLGAFGPGIGRPGRWNTFPELDDLEFVPERFGAGAIVADGSGNRFILTNHHVVRGGPVAGAAGSSTRQTVATRIYVRFNDRRGYFAEIHASDPRSDLAVLRIDYGQLGVAPPTRKEDFPRAVALSGASEHRKGQFVFVFGNPYASARDGSASAGWGIIGNVLRRPAPAGSAADPEPEKNPTIHHYGTLLQLDCRMDLGFSGGPAVDRSGELIGLTTSLAAVEGYESTAGFAIPVDGETRRLIDSLLGGHEVEYGFLGVEPADVSAGQLSVVAPGVGDAGGAVRAASVKAGSPAERTGLKMGDLILAIDGGPVRDTPDLMRRVGLAGPGAEVTFEVIRPSGVRGGTRLVFRARLDKWPVADEKEIVATVPRREPWRGLRVDYATARSRFLSPQLDPYPQGVVVLEAGEPGGATESIKAGDFVTAVNDDRVDTPQDFYAAVRGADSATLVLADGRRVTVQ